MKNTKIKIKKEIEFSIEELEQILTHHIEQEYNIFGDTKFDFKVVNKPCGFGIRDTIDRYVFDGVKIIVENT